MIKKISKLNIEEKLRCMYERQVDPEDQSYEDWLANIVKESFPFKAGEFENE